MITGIKIERLRGVKEGEVQGLTGLSILVGPNGCGKSTVLDGLLVGTATVGATGVIMAIERRTGVPSPLEWLGWLRGADGPVTVSVAGIDGFDTTKVEVGSLSCTVLTYADGKQTAGTTFRYTGEKTQYEPDVRRGGVLAALVEQDRGARGRLARLYSDAARVSRSALAVEILRDLVPGFASLEVLVEDRDRPVLYMHSGGQPVPMAMQGEGLIALTTLLLELAICGPGGLALLEEPEVHQHPRTLRLMAQGICEAVKRGVQVVLTTHSLELIENLLFFAGETQILDQTAVHMVRLRDNVLTATKVDGDTARFQIQDIGEDLR